MAKILILEDQQDLAEAWQALLISLGHEVYLANTYDEFENFFKSNRIELMIVDLSLSNNQSNPKFSGLVALSDNLLRGSLRGEKIPCIVVSGYFSDDINDQLRSRVTPFQPDIVLAKPFPLKDLQEAVEKLVD